MKNLFNNISESEKNRILEMHTGIKKTLRENRDVKDMSDTELSDTFVDYIGGRMNPDIETEDEFLNRFETGHETYKDTEFGKERTRRDQERMSKRDSQKRLPDDIAHKLFRKHKMIHNQHDNEQDWENAWMSGIDKVKDETDKWRENPDYDFGFED